jgi:hypothetical protein
MRKCILTFLLCLSAWTTNAQVKLTIDTDTHKDELSDLQYGIFFEEINHAGDGGLYAELIANRSFESHLATPKYLEFGKNYNGGAISSVSSTETTMLNSAQQHAVKVVTTGMQVQAF